MTYDPFPRGPLPVGVRTVEITDPARDRALTVELWYPAADAHRGQDLDPATQDAFALMPGMSPAPHEAVRDAEPGEGRHPLVGFSHGYSSHRRQSTHIAIQLASHGYVVVAPDHAGNTVVDVFTQQFEAEAAGRDARAAAVEALMTSAVERSRDLRVVLDHAPRAAGIEDLVESDACALGVMGHSFGGWTALNMPEEHDRVCVVVALAPSGGATPTFPGDNPLTRAIRLDWGFEVNTLVLAAELDSFLPLEGMRGLFARIPARTPGDKRMVVLEEANHLHFLDRVEMFHEIFRMMPPPALYRDSPPALAPIAEMCSPADAYAFSRALTLAHMDAWLKGDRDARRFLKGDLRGALAKRGIAARVE